jgi:hypothetical protein
MSTEASRIGITHCHCYRINFFDHTGLSIPNQHRPPYDLDVALRRHWLDIVEGQIRLRARTIEEELDHACVDYLLAD